jgi:hypothetical protein
MGLISDIGLAWRAPGRLIRAKLAGGVREDRALALAMAVGLMVFVAQWPRLAREAHLDPLVPFDARMGGALLGAVFILPLILYLVAALSHLVARALGGGGSWFGARLTLFWAMLASTPAMLLHGLASALTGPGAVADMIGAIVACGFLYLWLSMLIGAGRRTV